MDQSAADVRSRLTNASRESCGIKSRASRDLSLHVVRSAPPAYQPTEVLQPVKTASQSSSLVYSGACKIVRYACRAAVLSTCTCTCTCTCTHNLCVIAREFTSASILGWVATSAREVRNRVSVASPERQVSTRLVRANHSQPLGRGCNAYNICMRAS